MKEMLCESVFFGVMVFGEQLTFRLAIGIVMIIISVSLIIAGKAAAGRLNAAFFRLVERIRRTRRRRKIKENGR